MLVSDKEISEYVEPGDTNGGDKDGEENLEDEDWTEPAGDTGEQEKDGE